MLTLANREDMSALLMVVGLYLLLTGERPRAGLVVAAVGAVYFVVVKFILMPHFLGGATAYVHQYKDLVPAGRATASAACSRPCSATPATRPPRCSSSDKILYLLQIMAPLAFFPWRRPIGLLCSLPGFFFTHAGDAVPAR